MMNVLVVGSGGREHALVWRLRQCPSVARVACPHGNPGIAALAETEAPPLPTPEAWADFAASERFDLVVIGPEAPLAAGLADLLAARGIRCFGPTAAGARIEASKAFAKELMATAGIPTARSGTFTDPDRARSFAESLGYPLVVKADGLAAGKGVVIARTREEAHAAIDDNLRAHRFGEASATIVLEEFLEGEEASLLALTDGEEVWPLPPAEDYKRLCDGDEGPNTGGMGAYAPTPVLPPELIGDAWREVLVPAIHALRARGITYRGVLYAGLMVTADGIRVLEFNARFGDPETQVLMPLLEGDLAEAMLACAEGRLGAHLRSRAPLGIRPECALTIVLAAEGYPGQPRRGDVITGAEPGTVADPSATSVLFHAGTVRDAEGRLVTAGGRVLCATGIGGTLQEARRRAESLCDRITWRGISRRRDIGSRAQRQEG